MIIKKNKKEKDTEFSCEVLEMLGTIKRTENGYGKQVLKVSWNGKPATVDIRTVKWNDGELEESPLILKGISLSEEEANTLTNILLENGYGDKEHIDMWKKVIKKRQESKDSMSSEIENSMFAEE